MEPELIGKRYAVANRLKDEPDTLEKVIDYIKANGMYLVFSMRNSDFLIAFDEENREALLKTFKKEPTFKIITVEELLAEK